MKPAILLGKPIPSLSIAFHSLIAAPKTFAALLFLLAYLLAIIYCRTISYRDPTSYFFDPVHGYDKIYSLERERQAESFIKSANDVTEAHIPNAEPTLCVGVATVSRPKEQYIRSTIGSLLDGLTDSQRHSLHLILFIAHTDPHVHPIYGEKWVEVLPDTLLKYNVNETELAKIHQWEVDKDHQSKGLYDYAYLLQSCYDTGAPYIAMIEGDVLAVDGWYPRAVAAAEEVEAQERLPIDREASTWLYIRMFWTETYLGWNSEEWQRYLYWSLMIFVVLTVFLVCARTYSKRLQRHLSNPTLAVITLVCLPACISLYFSAGRVTMQPPPPGVRPMANYGCCSQGFIFARRTVPFIIDSIEHRVMDYIDMLLEAVAAGSGKSKWAIYPSLLQHIGGKSSKGDAISDSRAKMIWNFGFELYNAARLRAGRAS